MSLGLFYSFSASAQQTIFNVPSADVTGPGTIYLEHESQFRAWGSDRYWYGTHYLAYGLKRNTEADLTLYNLTSPSSDNLCLGMGFKSLVPPQKGMHPEREIRWTFGAQALVSLDGHGIGYWGYADLSGRIPRLKTRLTGGLSGGTDQLFGQDTLHFIGGIEQPVTTRTSLLADWYSGSHGLGFFTSGVSISLPGVEATLFLGYQNPNDSSAAGKPGLTFEVAKFF